MDDTMRTELDRPPSISLFSFHVRALHVRGATWPPPLDAPSSVSLFRGWLEPKIRGHDRSLSQRFAHATALRRERYPGLPVSAPEISGSSMLVRGSLLRSPARRPSDKGFCTDRGPASRPAERLSVFSRRRMPRRCFAVESRAYSGTDSGLEAFSRNPADGSFAPSARRPSTRTNCSRPRFLSY